MSSDSRIHEGSVTVEGYEIHYREAGEGPPVLLVHGWPTSSYLWRNIIPSLAESRRVIAIDLPGFGRSDKPVDVTYNFDFYATILNGFLGGVGVDERLGLAVHDLGGPVGMYWASLHPGRLERLALLNTLVYPEMSLTARAFLWSVNVPGIRGFYAGRLGLGMTMRLGINDPARLGDDVVENVRAPFDDRQSRDVLLRAIGELDMEKMEVIEEWLPTLDVPVQIVYGTKDRILPCVTKTMERVQSDLPQTKVHSLEDCGHFLQEERPQEIAEVLAGFFE